MNIYVDIDNTICKTNSLDYSKSIPIKKNIEKVNKLYNEKNTIIMWTARGSLTNKNWFDLTYKQLKEWGVLFHELRMGKPAYDLLIDDKALNSIYHWNESTINYFKK